MRKTENTKKRGNRRSIRGGFNLEVIEGKVAITIGELLKFLGYKEDNWASYYRLKKKGMIPPARMVSNRCYFETKTVLKFYAKKLHINIKTAPSDNNPVDLIVDTGANFKPSFLAS